MTFYTLDFHQVEKERDRERLDSKRKIEGMKASFGDEQDDTKKQITDLQYDLLELRDAHAKLRTTNEKLRRDKEKFGAERDEYKTMVRVFTTKLAQNCYIVVFTVLLILNTVFIFIHSFIIANGL